jgi:uroporphyrinogen-III synthase
MTKRRASEGAAGRGAKRSRSGASRKTKAGAEPSTAARSPVKGGSDAPEGEAAQAKSGEPPSPSKQGEDSEPGEAAAPAAPARWPWHKWLWTAAALFVIAAGGALAWSLWPRGAPEGQGPALDARLVALEERIEELEGPEGLGGLQKRVAELPSAQALTHAEAAAALATERASGLKTRIEDLEKAVAGVERGLAELRAAPAAEPGPEAEAAERAAQENAALLAELGARLEALESGARAEAAAAPGREALLVAVGQLREALRGSGPFAAELEVVDSLGAGQPEVERAVAEISPFAARGVATEEELKARFAAVAGAVVRASAAPEDATLTEEVLSRAAALVTVRRTGADVPGDSPEAVAARAEARLGAGDLAGAVAELETLTGPPAAAAETWLDDARARLQAESVLRRLHAHVIGQIPRGGGPSE